MPPIAPNDTAVIDEPWSASEQVDRLKTPITGAVGKAMYAWYDSDAADPDEDGYPDEKNAWSFPHHDVSTSGDPGAANIAACRNGLSRLSESDVPEADQEGVKKHLQHHLDAQKSSNAATTGPDLLADLRDLPRISASATAAVAAEYLPLVRAVAQSLTGPGAEGGTETAAARMTIRRGAQQRVAAGGMVAIIPLQGVITPRGSFLQRLFGYGAGGLEGFRDCLRQALADDEVSSIVIDIDSPGGLIDLVPETAAEIRGARGNDKKIVAVANTMAGSAAYWIAAQADELVVTPSGAVGSIGVYTIHEDISKLEEMMGITTTLISAGRFKTEGSPFGPLSRGALQALQSNVDDLYSLFVEDVAAGRNVKTQAVMAGYGEGRMVLADRALPLGMVDRVETLEQTITRLGGMPDDDDDETSTSTAIDPDEDEEEDDENEVDNPDDSNDDAQNARAESGVPADRLYGEDRRERPAWHL